MKRTHREIMRLLAAWGSLTGHARTVGTAAPVLHQEMGVEPDAATLTLAQRDRGRERLARAVIKGDRVAR
ncbi:MAG: hypothetical protein R2932_60205 [Caldilineaceae bacterium]